MIIFDPVMRRLYFFAATLMWAVCCSAKPDMDTDGPEICPVLSEYGMPIDFSRVGYMWGEKPLPDYQTQIVLTAPADGGDATAMIQNALNSVGPSGAVLLKEGLYNISGVLKMDRDGVVLRGEGEGTVLKALGTKQRSLVVLGKRTSRVSGRKTTIIDDFTPAGQMWVRVSNSSLFSVGDRVAICFRPSDKWIKALKMDVIAQNSTNSVKQWKASEYVIRWERKVMKVENDKVWLDNPVVMELDGQYMQSASLEHVQWDRITGSGIENLKMISDYDMRVTEKLTSGKYKGMEYCSDENHAWTAIEVRSAEHCWIRDVVTAYFGYSLVSLHAGSKNITVQDCVYTEPVSIITGSRRYAYNLAGGELCLIQRCRAEHDRHGFVTGARVPGPNVFLDCDMVHAYSDIGPHHRWSTGVLYDNCTTDGPLNVQDRAGYGTGHGWAGVSFVFWNCVAESIICQNPWINGQNWCIGCVGKKVAGRRYDDPLVRPDGTWISKGIPVEPASVYRTQFAARKERISE